MYNNGELLQVVSTGKVNMQPVAFCQNTIPEKLPHQQNIKTGGNQPWHNHCIAKVIKLVLTKLSNDNKK